MNAEDDFPGVLFFTIDTKPCDGRKSPLCGSFISY